MGVSKNEFVLKVTDHYLAHCDTILCSLDVKDKVIYVIDIVPSYQVHTNYYPTEKGLHISPSIIKRRQVDGNIENGESQRKLLRKWTLREI